MYLKTIGNVVYGKLKDGSIVRTTSSKGKTITEILDKTGKDVLLKRTKIIERTPIEGDVLELNKKAFPKHENFVLTKIKKILQINKDEMKNGYDIKDIPTENTTNRPTTAQLQVEKYTTGISKNGQRNVVFREKGVEKNLFNGRNDDVDFETNPMWNKTWSEREILVGLDETQNLSRNHDVLENISVPLEHSSYDTGFYHRLAFIHEPKFNDFETLALGEERMPHLKNLINKSTEEYYK